MRRPLLTTGLAATIVACGASAALAATGLADPIPAPIPDSRVTVALDTVASGFTAPVKGVADPTDGHRLYVVDQVGTISLVDGHRHGGRGSQVQVADLTDLVVSNLAQVIPGLPYDERGLLGLAFAPDFDDHPLAYTFQTEDATAAADFTTLPAGTAPDSQSVVREWRVRHADGDHPTFTGGRVLLRVDKPQFNHNGGDLAFGPDGLLYIGIGDGGAADDQGVGHVAGGNAQSLAEGNVLGKILRIDPRGRSSANGQYGIPRGNPFVGRPGADEIFAYGFRNPYRFSFDSRTGALWVGDVGQNDVEEVDVVRRGGNYGWPVKEGTFLFDDGGAGAGFVTADSPGVPAGMVDPVAQYDHTAPGGVRCGFGAPPSACQGIAITGGAVYRGSDVKGLRGAYVAGDYSQAFAAPLGRLWVVRGHRLAELGVKGADGPGIAVFGFGTDGHGELYVLGNTTGVTAGTTGVVLAVRDAG